jgi:transposase
MSNTFYSLGIDPAKRNFSACLLGPDNKEILAPREFSQDRQGYDQFAAQLATLVPEGSIVFAGVEASARLDDNLFAALRELDIASQILVLRLDPAQVKHFHGARPVRGKTDHSDARRIARFTATFAHQLDVFQQDPQARTMTNVVNERLALVRDITRLKNCIKDRLVASFPEFEKHFPDMWRPLPLALLQKAPTARHFACLTPGKLIGFRPPQKGSHRLGEERARALLAAAKSSIASATDQADADALRRLLARLEFLLGQLDELNHTLEQYVATQSENNPPRQIEIVRSVPGISTITAATVVLRSRGLLRFARPKALAAQLATHPDRFQTGTTVDHGKLSNRGDRHTRPLLFMAAMAACKNNPVFAFHYFRLQQRGLKPKQALCATMNRMTRLIWTLVQRNELYNPVRAIQTTSIQHPTLWSQFLKEKPHMAKKVEIIMATNTKKRPQEALT